MGVSNLQAYQDSYSNLTACSIPTPVRKRFTRKLDAHEFDNLGQEMFVDLDPARAQAALGMEHQPVSSGYFYVFGYCGRASQGTSFLQTWVPFRLYNAVQPGTLTDEASLNGRAIVKVSGEPSSGTSFILLFDGFGVLLKGERPIAEVKVLSVAFARLAGVE